MSWVTLEDGRGGSISIKHSRSKARTVEYSIGRAGPYELDVEQALIDGRSTSVADGNVAFTLVSKLGTEIWNGSVRTARNTKVVMTVCGPWRQTKGIDIDL